MPGYRETELLIREIKSRPVIWDSSLEEYKDKAKRAIAWREICYSVEENFADKSSPEQIKLVKELQARWKSIRDSYMKDCKRHKFRRRSSTGILRPRRYVFADLLTFLKKDRLDISREAMVSRFSTTVTSAIQPDTSGENLETELIVKQEQQQESECSNATLPTTTMTNAATTTSNSLNAPGFVEPVEFASEPLPKRPRWMQDETERTDVTAMDNDYHRFNYYDGDSEKDFFMSLLPIVRRLDEDQRLDFKAQVLLALRNVKAIGRNVDKQVPTTYSLSTGTSSSANSSNLSQIPDVASHRMAATVPPAIFPCPHHHHQVFPVAYTPLPPYSFVHFGL